MYGTNHPQFKRHTCVQKQKHGWYQTTRVHACKINALHIALIHMKYLPQYDPPYNR